MTTLANGIRNAQTTSSKHADRDVLALNEQNEARRDNEGENLMTRKTQGDLLHKLRQLRQWQQVQQENLLRDKERKLNFIREHEKRLQAVQEYQKKVLTQDRNLRNSPSIAVTTPQDQSGSKPLFHMQTHQQGFQEIPAGRQTYELEPEDLSSNVGNVVPVSRLGFAVLIPPQRTVLLSPQHFEPVVSPLENTAHNKNSLQILSAGKPHNSLLLTQKFHLPTSSDEELSQLTESDGGSVSDIDGIRPIEETASETTAENDSDSDGEQNEDGDQNDDDDDDRDDDDDDDDDNDDNDNDRDDDDDNENDDNDNEDNYEGCDTLNIGHYEPVEENSDEDNTLIDDDNEDVKQTYTSNEDLGINSKPLFDDIPIKPGLGTQAKTFEELLNEQLQVELKNEPKQQSRRPVTAKRTFLRKGEGIARFGLKTKKSIKEQNSSNREKTAQNSQGSTNKQKPIVTRKTATSKQSNTAQESSDQRPVFDQVVSRNRQLSSYVIGPYHSIDIAMDAHIEDRPGGKGDVDNVALRKNPFSAPVIEDSFQERMQKWDEMDIVEKEELNEFELLEEAAANCSLSSNSSTVLRILGKKKLQSVVDKNNNLPETVRETRFLGKGEDEDGDVVLDNGANNTLTEDKSDDDDDEDDTLKAPVDIISVHSSLALSHGFDDTKTWEDHGVLDSSDVIEDVILSLNTSTPVEKSRVQKPRATRSPHVSSAPPTSTLVTKFFPQLKAKAKEQTKNARLDQHVKPQQSPNASTVQPSRLSPSAPGGSISSNGAVEKVMSSAVREKLQELEKEIEKFREENAALRQLREAREKDLQELQREKTSFETYKTEELERLERFKAEEERRLRRDKRVFEQYQKASRALPDKKEREEITSLKAKINELQEDMKLRESRWSAAATRYKDRISNLEKENKEMKEEVKLLEKQNLDLQRKDKQKNREVQQFRAFEKRKLTKSQEVQTMPNVPVRGSQTANVNNVNDRLFIQENGKSKTPPSSPSPAVQESKKQLNVSSNKPLASADQKVSPAERPSTREYSTLPEVQRGTKLPTNEVQTGVQPNPSVTASKLKESSSLSKQNSSGKTVRFKEDELKESSQSELLPKEVCHNDGKREVINADGSRVVTFSNGTRKEISADGLSVIVTFFNGDVKQVMPDERVVYYYADAQTTHTTYPDGMQVLHFPSNQIEKHYPDGTKEITFPDQTVKYLYQSGAEDCVFADGTVERITGDGERIVEFPNGQRETYTKLFKKREYPDGTVKTVYTDGRQETRYSSGRLRVKDGEGRLLVDTAEQMGTQSPAST